MIRKIFGTIFFILSFLLGVNKLSLAQEIEAQSKITEVTVYPGSARVTREVSTNLTEGAQSIVLPQIIPLIDENSLTVSGQGTAEVKIFGASVKTEYLEESSNARVKELEKEIETTQDEISLESGTLTTLAQQREYLNSVKLHAGKQIPKDLVTTMPNPVYLEDVMNFLSKGFNSLKIQEQEVNNRIRELTRKLEALQRELADLQSGANKSRRSVVVDLECLKAGTLTLEISYLVNGANWRPVYDARSDYKAGEVELSSYGMVQQKTGEDWSDVKLTLSTARPQIGGRMPYVGPWFLSEYRPVPMSDSEGTLRRLGKSNSELRKDKAQEMLQYKAFDALSTPNMPAENKAEVAYADVAQQGVSIVYKITRPVSIKSDGVENKFPIATQVLKARFEYSTYPRLSPYAYLGSRVTNSKDLQLVAGQVNLFLDGEFVGKSSIDSIGPGQEFDLYLGIDENIKIKREQISKKIDDVLIAGIASPNIKTTYVYKLTVENATQKPAAVKLFEAIPVSQSERIKTKVFGISLEPTKKDWEDRKGIWLWELKLDPNAKKEIAYSFSVEHGRGIQVDGI